MAARAMGGTLSARREVLWDDSVELQACSSARAKTAYEACTADPLPRSGGRPRAYLEMEGF